MGGRRFDFRADQIATAATFFGDCVAQALGFGDGPCYSLRRSTANIKIRFDYKVILKKVGEHDV